MATPAYSALQEPFYPIRFFHSPFADLKVDVADRLTKADLERLAELFGLKISEQEEIRKSRVPGLKFIKILEKKCYLTKDNVDGLIEKLKKIDHYQLVNILTRYKEEIKALKPPHSEGFHSASTQYGQYSGQEVQSFATSFVDYSSQQLQAGQNEPQLETGSSFRDDDMHSSMDQGIYSHVQSNSDCPCCELNLEVLSKAKDRFMQSDCSRILEMVISQIQRSAVDIFIFFRKLYGHQQKVVYCPGKLVVKPNSLTHLNNLRYDIQSGYITEELTGLLLDEEMKAKMDQKGLYLDIQLDHGSFKAVHNFFVSKFDECNPERFHGDCFFCDYCKVIFNEKWKHEHHIKTKEHKKNINLKQGKEEWFERAIPSTVTNGIFQICQISDCPFIGKASQENHCEFAHTEDELEEWKKRHKQRLKAIQNIQSQKFSSSHQEKQKRSGKKSKRWAEFTAKVNKSEDLEMVGPVTYNEACEIAVGSSGSRIFVGSYMNEAVAVKEVQNHRIQQEVTLHNMMKDKALNNVLKMLHIERERKFTYVVTPLLEYDLHDVIEGRKGPLRNILTDEKRASLCVDILEGLKNLHSLEIIHRDLKPQNVLLDVNGTAYVADFGISRNVQGQTSHLTSAFGTQCWMASENCKTDGTVKYKKASDVQVAGFLIVYILSDGHHPFETTYPFIKDAIGLVNNLTKGKFSLSHVAKYGPQCTSLLEKMLDIDPYRRPGTGECLEEMKAVHSSYSFSFESDILKNDEMTFSLPDVEVTCSKPTDVFLSGKGRKKHKYSWQFYIKTFSENKLERVYLRTRKEQFFLAESKDQSQPQKCVGSELPTDSEGVISVTVHFSSKMYGCFYQWLMLDFGTKPVLCQQVMVWVGQEFASHFPKVDESSTPWDLEAQNVFKYPSAPNEFYDNLKRKYPLREEPPLSSSIGHQPSVENFREYFHSIVHAEEWACIKKLEKYNGRLKMNLTDRLEKQAFLVSPQGQLYGQIHLNVHLDDSEASQVVHRWVQLALLKFDQSDSIYEAKIVFGRHIDLREVNLFCVSLSSKCVSDQNLKANMEIEVDVQFKVDRNMFCNSHFAIENLRTKELLCPPGDMFPRFIEEDTVSAADDESRKFNLNHKQLEAKNFIVNAKDAVPFRQGPSLIIGPFGTGKTFTLARIIEDVLEIDASSNILICTHSNSAADLFLTTHLDGFLQKCEEDSQKLRVLRLYAVERDPSHIPDRIKNNYCIYEDYLTKFAMPSAKTISEYRLIVTTLATSIHLVDMKELRGHFTHIFIDEAGQALETETMIPLGLAGPRTVVVLAGDHKQMRPKVFSTIANKCNFKRSMLERLFYWDRSNNCNITHFLTDNYRMRQEILDFIGKHCYQVENFLSKLEGVSQASFYPMTFTVVNGTEHLNGLSYMNEEEALQIADQIQELKNNWPEDLAEYSDEDIVVLTPYKLQVMRMKQILKSRKIRGVTVDTVQNVQGQQFPVVFISPVRTIQTLHCKDDYYGILSDEGELVTAFTRARNYLFVVGDPVSLCSVGGCREIWKNYIQVCADQSSLRPKSISYAQIQNEIAELHHRQGVAIPSLDTHTSAISDQLSSLTQHQQSHLLIPVSPGNQDYDTDVEYEEMDDDLVDEIIKEINAQVEMERRRGDSESTSEQGEPSSDLSLQEGNEETANKQSQTPRKGRKKKRRLKFRLLEHDELCRLVKLTDSYDRSNLEGDFDSEDLEEEAEEMDDNAKEAWIKKTEEEPLEYCICVVRFASNHLVHAVPQSKHPAAQIKISNKRRRKRALDGDKVVVRTWKRKDVTYGEVMCILKRAEDLKWKRIVCTLDYENFGLMCPVGNSLLPKMFVFPKGAKPEPGSQDVRIGLYSINPHSRPKIQHEKDVYVKFKEMANKLFVVQYSKWFSTCAYPMGIVTEVLDSCESLESGLKILKLKYGVKERWSTSLLKEITPQFPENWEPNKEVKKRKDGDFRKKAVFTIGKSDLRDCDHAMHIEKLDDGRVVLGLHLTDVAFYVHKDSPVDMEAQRRGSSFHAMFSHPSHMLPKVLSTKLCKFNPNQDTLSVSILLTMDPSCTSVEKHSILRSVVHCKQNLTFEDVEDFLLNKYHRQFKIEKDVMKQVELLYKVFKSYPQVQVIGGAETEDQTNFPLAYGLVNGLRKLANTKVAEALKCVSPNQIPVCRQLPPHHEELQNWCSTFEEDGCRIEGLPPVIAFEGTGSSATKPMTFLKTTWMEVGETLISGKDKLLELGKILKCKEGHPKQAVALFQLKTITPEEEFICTSDEVEVHEHFTLQEDSLHPFMAPTRSYMDLIVLRMLVAFVEKQPNPYSNDDLSHITYHCTKQTQSAKKYEKSVQSFIFALKLKFVPHHRQALLQTASEDGLVFSYPFIGFLNGNTLCTSAHLALLKPGKRPEHGEYEGRSLQLKWRNRIYSYKCEAPEIRDHDSSFWLYTNDHIQDMPFKLWSKMVESVEQKKYDCLEDLENMWKETNATEMSSTLPEDSHSELIREVTCERMNTVNGTTELRKYVEFNRQFNPGDVVELQLCAKLQQGILGPMVQLFKMTPKFDLCLEHRGMPVECFTEVAEKLPAKCRNIEEYIDTWLPLLKMMVAYNSIISDETILIQDVAVSWCTRNFESSEKAVYGHFSLDKTWCDERQIAFGTLPKKKGAIRGFMDPTENFLLSDYICVRLHDYEINKDQQCQLETLGSKYQDVSLKTDIPIPKKSTLVVHGVAGTTNVGSRENVKEYNVEFQVTHTSCKIPTHLFDQKEPVSISCTVELIPKAEPEKRMEAALADVKHAGPLIQGIVLQDEKLIKESFKDKTGQLIGASSKIDDKFFQDFFEKQPPNDCQIEALKKALSQPFTVIQGPPGTGKTRTGAYLTTFFARMNRKLSSQKKGPKQQILYCGPSNKSVDVITMYLQKFESKKSKFVRVYSDTIEQQTFPVPGVESAERKYGYLVDVHMSEEVKKHALHFIIRSDEAGGNGKKIREMDKQFENGDLKPTSKNIKKYKDLVRDTKINILKSRDIILCTCNAAGHFIIRDNLNISQCIIDEAGMCFELDTLIPLVTQKPKQVVLIGDHKQLRPIIQDPRAKHLGAEISLMEKFQGVAYTLKVQYRMHEDICKFPSAEFYSNELETDETVKRRPQFLPSYIWPGKNHFQRVFCHVEGIEDAQTVRTAEGNEMSRSNEKEANEVVRIAETLIRDFKVHPKDLIILSQYRLQCQLIKDKLHIKQIKVQTIIKSQGSEWDFVILSLVRSLPEEEIPENPGRSWKRINLGFIEDENQMNVGLTRAMQGLVIVGDKKILKTCSKWMKLIKHYEETGSVIDAVNFLR